MTLSLLFVLLCLSSYSLIRLIAMDDVSARPRNWLLAHMPKKLRTGFTCPWCIGWWISAALVLVVDKFFQNLPMPVAWAAAMRVVVGLIGNKLDAEEEEPVYFNRDGIVIPESTPDHSDRRISEAK